ncbi:MAG: M24 family metallopeptidase [Chloroflexota bacterium]
MTSIVLAPVTLPEPGVPDAEPVLPPSLFADRLARLRAAARARGYDRLFLWADREHSASLAWLSGFDPRFEEAVLLVRTDDASDPALLVGNECWGMVPAAPLPMRRILLQDLSLPDQPRDRSEPLPRILAAEGFGAGSRIGVIGWKPYADRSWLEIPAWVATMLHAAAGPGGRVENANDLLVSPTDGLRTINEPEQLAAFEWAACHVSEGVKRLIHGLRPGLRERDAVALLGWNGMPLSCHLMLTAGPRARFGMLSPGDRPMEAGDPFTTAYGIWGALTCRAGWLVRDAAELPAGVEDYLERLAIPYWDAATTWMSALRVGVPGGTLDAIVQERIGDPFFGLFLNPGHLLHLDEWVASPIAPGSTVPLRSGMAIQVDIIPATGTPWFTSNIEDGFAIADAALRAELAQRFPAMWQRIGIRRAFLRDTLGVALHPDTLPLSNIAGWLPPFLLDPGRALVRRG